MLEKERLASFFSDGPKRIFFYRICGTGMGAAACLLREAGHHVEGADLSFGPPMDNYLENQKIPTYHLKDVDKEKLNEFDIIVVGNSVPRVSEYSKLIEECGVPFTSFPSLIGELVLKDKTVIGVAGTHGKTTTTFFLKQMLNTMGDNTGYFIGGIVDGIAPASCADSKFFVIESDEYDSAYFQKYPKFLSYQLNSMILTSLEFDHADIYDNVEQIENEFSKVLDSMDIVVADSSYPSISKLVEKHKETNWKLYHQEGSPEITSQNDKGTEFTLSLEGGLRRFKTSVVGHHNILNISSCLIALHHHGFSLTQLKDSVEKLSMVKRRQEFRGTYKGATVIDDFAHHPRAVKETIKAIKIKYPSKRIITVFEPISATARSNIFQNEFAESFDESDITIFAKNSLATTVKGSTDLDVMKICSDLIDSGSKSRVCTNLEDLIGEIDKHSGDESLFLILSNRSCLGLWESSFVQNLS